MRGMRREDGKAANLAGVAGRDSRFPESRRHPRVQAGAQPSQAGSFFFTATFFSVTYFGSPSRP